MICLFVLGFLYSLVSRHLCVKLGAAGLPQLDVNPISHLRFFYESSTSHLRAFDEGTTLLRLLHDAFFEVLGKVGAHLGGCAFGSDLGNVVLDHQLYQLLEGGLGRIPTQLGLGLGGVAPEVHHVGGTVEVLAHGHHGLSSRRLYIPVAHASARDDINGWRQQPFTAGCPTLLRDGRAGPADMGEGRPPRAETHDVGLELLVLFFQEKRTENQAAVYRSHPRMPPQGMT